jgi:ATP-binding cassette subfamily B multidrug efflux pump
MLFLGAVMAEFFASAVQVYALQRVGYVTISDLRRAIFRHVLRLPARFYDKTPIGSLLSRSTSDVEALSETLAFGVFTILTDVAVILSIVAAMFVLDARLTLISLAVAPMLPSSCSWFSGRLRALQLEIRKAQSVQSGYLAEQLAGVTVVQLYGREAATAKEFERLGGRYLRATKTANWYDASLYSLMDGISALCVALLIYFAAPELFPATPAATGVTLGLLFAFIDYLQRVFVPIREFSAKLATIQRAVASLERIYGLLDEPAEARAPPATPTRCTASPAASPSATSASATAPTPARSCAASPSTSPRRDRRRRRPHRLGQDQPRPHPHPHLRRLHGHVRLAAAAGPVEVRDVIPDALRATS